MKPLVLLSALLLLAACVQIPEEAEPAAQPAPEALPAAPPAVEQPTAQPPAIAPLPEQPATTSSPAPTPPSTTTPPASANSTPQQKTVQTGWTTEPVSITEGETKYVYIKK